MRMRELGRTGIKVSPYALGTMMFGAWGNPDHGESIRIIHKALDAGINLVDTADVYSGGESEEIVGKALKGRRDDIVLATKVGNASPSATGPNTSGGSRRWIVRAVEDSLRRLGTDYIDLYQIHRLDPSTDIEETLSALTDLLRSGKVRAIGTSTFPAAQLVEAQWIAEHRALARFRTEQLPYSIIARGAERDVLPLTERYGMGVLVWSPLGSGLLTGRYRKGHQPTGGRVAMERARFTHERKLDAVEKLIPLAEEAGVSLTHMAMAFVVGHPAVSSALLGPRTMEQLDDLLAGADTVLGDDVLDRIDEIVPPGVTLDPHDLYFDPPALRDPALRRRTPDTRSAA
ncbi:aldo/keto reductase [Streptomyces sp. WAC 01529]|uniref:aldo/keto reductase n=1 Tax=Streptomyces sp. WAC 01529 TaxID=2203205 RepID=UPI000F6D717E|nr:aldo/keto reductase [Streptomyces sp. WAC 01529]AZM56855.1 aldo/keto reductase [Streptomyces sp. WAC 01529]